MTQIIYDFLEKPIYFALLKWHALQKYETPQMYVNRRLSYGYM